MFAGLRVVLGGFPMTIRRLAALAASFALAMVMVVPVTPIRGLW
jgi:hypothetical protein